MTDDEFDAPSIAAQLPTGWPRASISDSCLGWTLDYKFLDKVEQLAKSRTEYSTSMEATEQVLIAALEVLAAAHKAAPAAQGDALPREDFARMVVQEACETEPADEDDPECIRILRRDLKSAVLAAFLREDAARAQQEHKP